MLAQVKEQESLLLTYPWKGTPDKAIIELRNAQNEKLVVRAVADGLLLRCSKCKQEYCFRWCEHLIWCFLAWAMTGGRKNYVGRCPHCEQALLEMGIVEKQGLLPTERQRILIEAKEVIEAWHRDANYEVLEYYEALEYRLSELIEGLGEPVLWIQ